MITENLSTLKIHRLTQEQYNRELAADRIDKTAMYLTPAMASDIDLSNASGILPIEKGGTGNDSGYIRTGWKEVSSIGDGATIEGKENIASGYCSHAEGTDNIASGSRSHSEGWRCEASGMESHAEGLESVASGHYSHVEGSFTRASGGSSHAEGSSTSAQGGSSHAEGSNSVASGYCSHAEGSSTTAYGRYSHTEGKFTVANNPHEHVQGKCNIQTPSSYSYAHVVGNGYAEYSTQELPEINLSAVVRNNCYTLDWCGNATFAGFVTGSGSDYAEYFEWTDGNPDNEDRIGLIVTLDGEKIRLANSADDILGIVSGTAVVIGDNAEWQWKEKYLHDDYGRVMVEMIEECEYVYNAVNGSADKISLGLTPHYTLNPNYDSSQEYVRRADRPEWATVGLIGKLHVTDDGSCVVGEYATVGNNGVATNSETKTNMKVMKRISDTVVLVFMK